MTRSELYRLARDQDYPQTTVEIHKPNDFYHHASYLKQYAGLPSDIPLKAVIKHGTWFGEKDWTADLNAPLPVYIDFSSYRLPRVATRTNKALFSTGPYIHYAPDFLSDEDLDRERTRLGKSLLVFPAHSTHWIDTDFDLAALVEEIGRLAPLFETVRICLYWKDIIKGAARSWMDLGYECVTAGHIFDREFLPRLRSLISVADVTMSNIMSTHVGYCVYFDKPHYLFRQKQTLTNQKHNTLDLNDTTLNSPEAAHIEETFAEFSFHLAPEQREVAARYFGLDEVRSPQWINRLFSLAEEMHPRFSGLAKGGSVPQIEFLLACFREGRMEDTLFLVNASLLAYPDLHDLHYLKAYCLNMLGDSRNALLSLETLFSLAPDHANGKALLKDIRQKGR